MSSAPRVGLRPTRLYLRVFFLVLGISLGSIFVFSEVIMLATGENRNVDGVVARQQEAWTEGRICLFGSALSNTVTAYKLAIYRAVKPDVLVLGSSRVLQMRPDFFSVPMVNAGGAGTTTARNFHFLREAFAVHVPKYVLLGVDFWSFNESFEKPENMNLVPSALADPTLELNNRLLPLKWVYDGKVKLSKLLTYASNCHLGAPAAINKDGYGPFGSRYQNSIIYGYQKNGPVRFNETLDRIRTGRVHFAYGESVSEKHYANFAQVVRFLRESGVAFSIILTPVARAAYDEMKSLSKKYQYVWELERRLVKDFDVSNFHDPRKVSASDCEFIDGFHGGDLVYARIVAEVAEKDPRLGELVDQAVLDRLSNLRGLAYGGRYRFFGDAKEVDFMQLGCDKQAAGKAPDG